MRIYLASSWKNQELVHAVASFLRQNGHEVDAFCDESSGRYVFHFSEIGDADELDAISFLADTRSQKAFEEDKKWLEWCDVCVMILPCGNSAHLEAGYAKGIGKQLVIYGRFKNSEFDVMYGFADALVPLDEPDFLLEVCEI